MLPLWIYRDNLSQFLALVTSILSYETNPDVSVRIPFKWESIAVTAAKKTDAHATEPKIATWNKLLENPSDRRAIQQTLLEASLFLPPLYVGMTNNLKRRYIDHTDPPDPRKNVFHNRLQQCLDSLELKLSANDLLFVSLTTPSTLSYADGDVTEKEFNELVEQILMQSCRPTLSER